MLKDKVDNFMEYISKLNFGKNGGYVFNGGWTNGFAIRTSTTKKIRELIYNDLMETCIETEFGMRQPYEKISEGVENGNK